MADLLRVAARTQAQPAGSALAQGSVASGLVLVLAATVQASKLP